MKNYWGESDEEPLPDWMNPATYRHGNNKKARIQKSLEDVIQEALKKPPVPIVMSQPKDDDLK